MPQLTPGCPAGAAAEKRHVIVGVPPVSLASPRHVVPPERLLPVIATGERRGGNTLGRGGPSSFVWSDRASTRGLFRLTSWRVCRRNSLKRMVDGFRIRPPPTTRSSRLSTEIETLPNEPAEAPCLAAYQHGESVSVADNWMSTNAS